MLFDAIFLSLLTAGWLICGYTPWLILSVATKGHAGMRYLPLCLLAALVGGLAVPLLGMTGWTGLWVSYLVALALPTLLLAARRFSLPAAEARAHREAKSAHSEQPK